MMCRPYYVHTYMYSLYVPSNQVPIVNSLEYKRWRHNGVAYQLREDAVYETPNRTLASGVLTLKV